MHTNTIDTGDTVRHAPSGETWVVAYVKGDRLAWCGWPNGEAALVDCTLIEKATPEYRSNLLAEMVRSSNPSFSAHARMVATPVATEGRADG